MSSNIGKLLLAELRINLGYLNISMYNPIVIPKTLEVTQICWTY